MSTVFYRWGAGRDESRVTFDGTHISVFDLKREIILANRMGNGKDFDIGIFDNVTGEEFKDDNHQIPRSSSLIARRLPSSIKGRGNAQNYIMGTSAAEALTGDHRIEAGAKDAMLAKARGLQGRGGTFGSLSRRFDGKEEKKAESAAPITTGDADEDARIAAMFAQSADQWEQTQEDMSLQPARVAAGYRPKPGRPAGQPGAGPSKFDYSLPPDKEPPVGYICYRCGQKGHWIQNCPTLEDPAAQERKRFVRVTGIPRSFLKTVETPTTGEGSSQGAMLTADGGFVRAVPDQRQWQKHVAAKPRALTGAEVRSQQPQDADLTCPICRKLVWEAVRTPCCNGAFCEECITTHLLEHDFECPACESRVASLDSLKPDGELRQKVKGYVDGEIERSKREEDEAVKEGRMEKSPEDEEPAEEGAIKPDDGGGGGKPDGDADSDNPSAPALDPAKMQEMLNPQTMQIYLAQVHKMLQNPQLLPQARVLLQTQMQMVQATVMQMQLMAASGMMGGQAGGGNVHPNPSANGNGNGANAGPAGPRIGNGMSEGMGGMGGMGGMHGMMQSMDGGMGQDMGMGMGMGIGMGMGMGMGMNMGMGGMGGNMGQMGGMGGMGGMGQMGQMGQMGGMGQMGNGMNMGGGMPSRGRGFNRGMGFQRGRGGFARGGAMGAGRAPKRGPDEAGFDMGGGEKQARVA